MTSVTPGSGATGVVGFGGADGDVLPGGGAEHGVVHAEGLGRERGRRRGELQTAGNTVATFTPTNSLASSTTYTATVSGAQNSLGHADEQPVLVELHHRRAAVPVQHLAERDADRVRRTRPIPAR